MEEKVILKFIEYFYKKTFDLPKKYTIKEEKSTIKYFLKKTGELYLKDSLNTHFLFSYLSYQFNYWGDKTVLNEFSISWVLGAKALERWKSKSEHWGYYNRVFRKKRKIYYTDLVEPEENPYTLLLDFEEDLKKNFKSNVLKNCVRRTSLFNPKSTICLDCENKDRCILVQKALKPEYYYGRNSESYRESLHMQSDLS